jgi:hypothetical protein
MAALLLATAQTAVAAASPAAATATHNRAFWMQLLQECKVPKGESAAALVDEAVSFQSSRESFWRDDVGFQVVVRCVYREHRLSPEERRKLVDALAVNLRRGIGESGTDTVFLRSFSALDLSVIQALELQDPVLDDAGFRSLVDAALAYLVQEKDGRGFEPDVGWIHATAHTADLLKFLARDPRFTPADQARLLEASWAKATAAETPGWDFGEEERLASALLSVTRRTDFDAAAFDEWLAHFGPFEKNYRNQEAPDLDAIEAGQNARALLQSLYVQLSLEQPSPTPAQQAARSKTLETLRQIRR